MCSTYPTNKEALFCLFTGCYSTLGTGYTGYSSTLPVSLGRLTSGYSWFTGCSTLYIRYTCFTGYSLQLISQERKSSLGNFLQFQKFDIPPCLKLTCKSFKLDFASMDPLDLLCVAYLTTTILDGNLFSSLKNKCFLSPFPGKHYILVSDQKMWILSRDKILSHDPPRDNPRVQFPHSTLIRGFRLMGKVGEEWRKFLCRKHKRLTITSTEYDGRKTRMRRFLEMGILTKLV